MYINEKEYSYRLNVEFAQFEKSGYLSPAGYQHLSNVVVDRHLSDVNLNFERLFEFGISWVLLSITFDIVTPITDRNKTLIGTTWYSGRKGIFFRREIEVCDEEGTVHFRCSSYSTMLNLTTRSIFRNRELPFDMMEPTDQILTEAKPTFKERLEFEGGESTVVKRSHLDMLGHVNNGRYGEFCFDALSDDEADMQRLRHMEVYFVSELTMGEEFSVGKSVTNNRIVLQGMNDTQGKPSFYGVYEFV